MNPKEIKEKIKNDLVIEILARFRPNSRAANRERDKFIDGANFIIDNHLTIILTDCQSQKVQAYKAGYEKRICEQIDLALSGQGQNSGYNKEQLEKNIEAYLIETKKD